MSCNLYTHPCVHAHLVTLRADASLFAADAADAADAIDALSGLVFAHFTTAAAYLKFCAADGPASRVVPRAAAFCSHFSACCSIALDLDF